MVKSDKYWIKRAKQVEEISFDQAFENEKNILDVFEGTQVEMQDKLNAFYNKYAKENNLTRVEAEKVLTKVELKEYAKKINLLKKKYENTKNERLKEEISKLVTRGRITRLQSLIQELSILLGIFSSEYQSLLTESLGATVATGYYRTMFEIQRGTGVGFGFAKVSPKLVDTLVNTNWSGKHFSTRIWKNKQLLVKSLEKELKSGITAGKSIDEITRMIGKKINGEKEVISRLVRTETNHILNQSAAKTYEEVGLDEYKYLATLDSRTSDVCQKADGKVHKVKDKQVGKNYPPLHPNCRSTIIPHFSNLKGTRIARDENGENYKVSNTITYEKWSKNNDL